MLLLNLRPELPSIRMDGGEQRPAEQSRTHQENKGMYRPNEIFFSTEYCGSGDKNQRAASNEVPAMTSLFTIRNTTSLPGLQIAAHIDIIEQRATILRTAKLSTK